MATQANPNHPVQVHKLENFLKGSRARISINSQEFQSLDSSSQNLTNVCSTRKLLCFKDENQDDSISHKCLVDGQEVPQETLIDTQKTDDSNLNKIEVLGAHEVKFKDPIQCSVPSDVRQDSGSKELEYSAMTT